MQSVATLLQPEAHLRSLQCQLPRLQSKPRQVAQKLEQPCLSCAWLCRRCRPGWPLTRLQSGAFTLYFGLQALQTGAASYLTPEQRFQMGIVRPSHRDEAADHSHALRFTAYERTAAPAAAAGQAAGGRGSPAFGQRDSPVSQAGQQSLGHHRGVGVDDSDAESLRPAGSCVRTASGERIFTSGGCRCMLQEGLSRGIISNDHAK